MFRNSPSFHDEEENEIKISLKTISPNPPLIPPKQLRYFLTDKKFRGFQIPNIVDFNAKNFRSQLSNYSDKEVRFVNILFPLGRKKYIQKNKESLI